MKQAQARKVVIPHKIYIYVCLGSKIPWTRMYIAKQLTKIYVYLGSKIPHGKKREQKERARKEKEGTKKENKKLK